jgi:gas vesicle protein
MTTLAYLTRNIWASGWITEPKLVVIFYPPADRILTLRFALFDANGYKITDEYVTNIPAGTQIKTVELGDYLSAQQSAKNFGSGVYYILLKIDETGEELVLPLLVTLGTIYPPSIPDKDYLVHYTVFDIIMGAYFNLPPSIEVIPSDPRFRVYAYIHKGNKGRLIGFDELGNIVFDTDYHQLALVTFTLKFAHPKQMLLHVMAHSYGLTAKAILEIARAIDVGDYNTALNILRPFYMISFLGRILTTEFDIVNFEIRHKTQIYLGQFDWSKIFSWGAIGCGVTVLGVVAVTAVTAGVGAITAPLIAGACVAGGVIGAGLAVLTSTSSDKPETTTVYVTKIVEEGEKAKQQNQQYYNDAKGILDKWLSEGKITQDDYNQMMTALNAWKTGMDSAIDDIVKLSEEMVKKAYDDGYKKGVSESKAWIIGAGAGGLLVGFLLGRR